MAAADRSRDGALAILGGGGRAIPPFHRVLPGVGNRRGRNDQAARKQLIDFIQNNGISTEDAKKARRRLSSILFG